MGASDDPPEATIEPHLEMSYSENMPGKIIFYCHQAPPPSAGGQTPVCDMRSVYRALKDRKKELGNIMDAGVRYYRTLPSIHTPEGRLYSWQKTFPGLGRQEVDSVLAHKGIHWESFTPPTTTTTIAQPISSFPAATPQDLAGTGAYTDAEASNMRKVIAKRLQQSKHEIPHYYLTV